MPKGVAKGILVLKNGGVIVFPTETAYGLGCDACLSHAVEKVAHIKGRDVWKTPPLIAADLAMVERYVVLSDRLRRLAKRFWPGPLTIVAPVKEGTDLSPLVIREGTVAIRVSADPTARALSRAIGAPLVATSANSSGQDTCYRLEDVRAQLGTQLPQPDFFVDGNALEVRPTSTIICEKDGEIVVIRQGNIDVCSEPKNHSDKIG